MILTITSDGPGSYLLTTEDGAEIMAGNDMRMLAAMARAMGHKVEVEHDLVAEFRAAVVAD